MMGRMLRVTLLLSLPAAFMAVSVPAAAKAKSDAIDSCVRSGGAWNYRTDACESSDPGPVDFIRVDKSDHWMAVYRAGKIVREFRIALGRGGLGPKQQQGDGRVPEGQYLITRHNPHSAYHLSLRIGYPTIAQVAAAQAGGFHPGGDIMIHGLPSGKGWIGSRQRRIDWTQGCIAVSNPEIEWLYRTVADGTPIIINP